MTSNYQSDSPFYLTPIKNGFLGYYVDRKVIATEDDVTIVLEAKFENAPDLLVESFYGTGYDGFWWIVAKRNGLKDPIFDMKPGITLIMPPRRILDAMK